MTRECDACLAQLAEAVIRHAVERLPTNGADGDPAFAVIDGLAHTVLLRSDLLTALLPTPEDSET